MLKLSGAKINFTLIYYDGGDEYGDHKLFLCNLGQGPQLRRRMPAPDVYTAHDRHQNRYSEKVEKYKFLKKH